MLYARRGWDWQGNECWIVLEPTPLAYAPPWTKVYRARIDYGPVGTKIDLGEVVASDLKMIKAAASDRARHHGFVPRSDWAPFDEEAAANPRERERKPRYYRVIVPSKLRGHILKEYGYNLTWEAADALARNLQAAGHPAVVRRQAGFLTEEAYREYWASLESERNNPRRPAAKRSWVTIGWIDDSGEIRAAVWSHTFAPRGRNLIAEAWQHVQREHFGRGWVFEFSPGYEREKVLSATRSQTMLAAEGSGVPFRGRVPNPRGRRPRTFCANPYVPRPADEKGPYWDEVHNIGLMMSGDLLLEMYEISEKSKAEGEGFLEDPMAMAKFDPIETILDWAWQAVYSSDWGDRGDAKKWKRVARETKHRKAAFQQLEGTRKPTTSDIAHYGMEGDIIMVACRYAGLEEPEWLAKVWGGTLKKR